MDINIWNSDYRGLRFKAKQGVASVLFGVMLLLLSCRMFAAERTWNTEEVGHGVATSLAIDSRSNLHMVYLTRDARLMYAFRPASSSKWYSVQILNSTHASQNVYPRVAVDSLDRPNVCVAIGTLQYITFSGGKWTTREIDPDSGTLSYHCSIAFGSDGTPHLSWYHEFLPGGKQFTHVRHAELVDGQWVVRSVDGGIAGKWNSMVIDPKGNPHLTYSQWASGGDIRYASWDGKDWTIEGIPTSGKSDGYRGYDNSLALSEDGSPHISYFDDNTLRYAYRKDGKWTVEKVADISAQYDFYQGSTSLFLDKTGMPHIVYGDVGAVKHAYWDGKNWQVEIVASGGLGQYANVDGLVGPDGTIYVSYSDPLDGQVKVAISKVVPETKETKN
jgi:hypothetical protein